MSPRLPPNIPNAEDFQEILGVSGRRNYLDFVENLIEDSDESVLNEAFSTLRDLNAQYVKGAKEDTLTLKQAESLLEQLLKLPAVSQRDYLLEFLYREKARFLLSQHQIEEALQNYEEALRFNPESPFSWFMKGSSLATLGRFEEAFQAFARAYDLRENFLNSVKKEWTGDLLFSWIYVAFWLGFLGAYEHDSRKLKAGAEEYIKAMEKAKAAGIEEFAVPPSFQKDYLEIAEKTEAEGLQEFPEGPIKDAFEEFAVAVKLLSIKDPFDRLRALSKEVSKVWPEGLSAVEAVREQRDHEWNP